jgi:membrane protease YdiL (CAAX protease family)
MRPAKVRPLTAFVCYFVLVILGAALLTPWFYWSAQVLAGLFSAVPVGSFGKFQNHLMMGLAVVGLYPLLRAVGFTSLKDLGVPPPNGQWRNFAFGFVAGFAVLGATGVIVLLTGARVISDKATIGLAISYFAFYGTLALGVALIEEPVFRGGVFGVLRCQFPWRVALVASSVIFAVLHFLRGAQVTEPMTWYSGLAALPGVFSGLADVDRMIPSVFGLFLIAMMFGLAYQRTGTLYMSIGLHAGGLSWIRVYRRLTEAAPDAPSWFFGTGYMLNGWLTVGVLVLGLIALDRILKAWDFGPPRTEISSRRAGAPSSG